MPGLVEYPSSDDESDNSVSQQSTENESSTLSTKNESFNNNEIQQQTKQTDLNTKSSSLSNITTQTSQLKPVKKIDKRILLKKLLKLSDEDIQELYDDKDEQELEKKKKNVKSRTAMNSKSGLFNILPSPVHELNSTSSSMNNPAPIIDIDTPISKNINQSIQSTDKPKVKNTSSSTISNVSFDKLQEIQSKVFSNNFNNTDNYSQSNSSLNVLSTIKGSESNIEKEILPSTLHTTGYSYKKTFTPQQYQSYVQQNQVQQQLTDDDLRAKYGEYYDTFDKPTKEALLMGTIQSVDQTEVHDPSSLPTTFSDKRPLTGFEPKSTSDVVMAHTAKQKHQISYLAQDAAAKLNDIDFLKAQERMKKKQTKARYGW